jgi:hypothetical protein
MEGETRVLIQSMEERYLLAVSVVMAVLRFSSAKWLCQLDYDWLINHVPANAIDSVHLPSAGLTPV